jgi:hypothetical protein
VRISHKCDTPTHACIGLSIAEVVEKSAHDPTQALSVWLTFGPEAVNQLIPNRKKLQQRLELVPRDLAGRVEFAHKRGRRETGKRQLCLLSEKTKKSFQ